MKKIEEENKQIEEVLNSLDGIVRADAPTFFYTRLQARLREKAESSLVNKVFSFFAKPVFAIATLSVFVLLNVFAITSLDNAKGRAPHVHMANEGTLQNVLQEYDLSVPSVYTDNKNNQQ